MADIKLVDVPFLDWPMAVTSTTNSPPGSPSTNDSYVVGSSPTGAWSGHAGELAVWSSSSAWDFQTPTAGRVVWNVGLTGFRMWNGTAWVELPTKVPTGGSTGQILAKASGTDYDVAWATNHPLPTGGSTGQALRKNSGTDYDASFAAVHEVPSGGTTGQALTKNSGTDYDAGWSSVAVAGAATVVFFANTGSVSNAVGSPGDLAVVGGNPSWIYYKDTANTWHAGGSIAAGGGTLSGITTTSGSSGLSGGGTTGTLTMAVDVHGTTLKATPTTSDELIIADSAASNALKRVTVGTLPFTNLALGTTGSTAAAGNDSRLSDDRTAAGLRSATTVVAVSSATAPTTGQVLTATGGSAATWQSPAGGAPTGSAGGDLGSTYPNPTVVQARGLVSATTTVSVSAATAPTTGQVLTATSGTAATWQTPTGGAASDLATSGANVNVSAAAPPSAGQILIATDATHATWQTPATSSAGASPLWTPPTSAHANDQEFDSTSLPAGWELWDDTDNVAITPSGAVNPYASNTSTHTCNFSAHTNWRKSFMALQPCKEAASHHYTYTTKPGGGIPTNCYIWARFGPMVRFTQSVIADLSYGIVFSATDGGNHAAYGTDSVAFYLNGGGGSTMKLTLGMLTGGVFSGGSIGPNIDSGAIQIPEYLLLHKIGTTYHAWAMNDSGMRYYWGSLTHAATMAHVGFYFRNFSNSNPGNPLYTFDFFRQVDTATALPT